MLVTAQPNTLPSLYQNNYLHTYLYTASLSKRFFILIAREKKSVTQVLLRINITLAAENIINSKVEFYVHVIIGTSCIEKKCRSDHI